MLKGLKTVNEWLGQITDLAKTLVVIGIIVGVLFDDFLTYSGNGITSDLISGYEKTGKSQLSVMKVDGPDISKYGVIVPNNKTGLVTGLIEKPNFENAPSNLASIGRYVLTPDIFDILRNQSIGVGGEIQLADSINVQASNNMVEIVLLNGKHHKRTCNALISVKTS